MKLFRIPDKKKFVGWGDKDSIGDLDGCQDTKVQYGDKSLATCKKIPM